MADKNKKEIQPIVKGHIKKKGLGEKAAEVFLSEDTRTVKDYVLWELVIPGIKNAVISMLEVAFFGSSRGTRKRNGGGSYVSYQSYYDSDRDGSSRSRMDRSNRNSPRDFSGVIVDTMGEAEDVCIEMRRLVDTYDEATVADLYSMVGVSGSHMDNKWGWTRENADFRYRRSSGGYLLDFAKPEYLG